MKIVFNRQMISTATAPLMCAVSGKSTLTATEGILIEASEDGTCVMTTFDLEKGMRITVNADVKEAGSAVINAQKFSQTMKVMDGDEVELTVDQKLSATISCGTSQHKMGALEGASFPALPKLREDHGLVIKQKVLRDMLSRVSYAMAVNDQRPVLNGCFVKITGDQLMVVSCDSFKLAKCVTTAEMENKNEDGSELNFSFIIPVKTVNELTRMLSDNEEDTVLVHPSRKNIVFELGDMTFFSRLVDGDYIDYDRIILKNHRIFITANRNRLISALERAALVTDERIAGSVRSHVKLQLDGGVLQITATSVAGSTYDDLDVKQEGDPIVIAFNNRFLIDSVRACDAENVRISLTTPLTSINIEPADGEETENVFMLLPVRMKD